LNALRILKDLTSNTKSVKEKRMAKRKERASTQQQNERFFKISLLQHDFQVTASGK
jgi:hypothetical protein